MSKSANIGLKLISENWLFFVFFVIKNLLILASWYLWYFNCCLETTAVKMSPL